MAQKAERRISFDSFSVSLNSSDLRTQNRFLKICYARQISKTSKAAAATHKALQWQEALALVLPEDCQVSIEIYERSSNHSSILEQLGGVLEGTLFLVSEKLPCVKTVDLYGDWSTKPLGKLSMRVQLVEAGRKSVHLPLIERKNSISLQQPAIQQHFNVEAQSKGKLTFEQILPHEQTYKSVPTTVRLFSMICNLDKLKKELSNSSLRVRLGAKALQTETARNRKNQPVWIEELQFNRQEEESLVFQLIQSNEVIANGLLRLNSLTLNTRHVSRRVQLSTLSGEKAGTLFVDVILSAYQSQDKEKPLPKPKKIRL